MSAAWCSACGARRDVSDGDQFPAHPDARQYPRFIWCAFGDMSFTIGEVSA